MKKRLITSALPYVNNEPHLGNIVGCVLSADVFARFSRLKGYEVLYVCGTDEYGTATETKARQENCTPKEICDKYHKIHKSIYESFNISFDIFGRTSSPEHTIMVQEIFTKIEANKGFVEKESEQLFCNDCLTYLADRLVYGQCPKCPSSSARGDQCDVCGILLTPVELIEPHCGICFSKSISVMNSKHLYLDLSKYQDELNEWQAVSSNKGEWASNAIKTTQSWMTKEEGLQPRAVTRNLKWGVPVPKTSFENKVFYVWFDAPIGYVSITSSQRDDWQDWWYNPTNVELYQFMGKDNIPFHSIIFPATQIASGIPWTKVHKIASVEYLNYEDTKFSKSRNVGIFGTDVIERTNIPIDLWRFYLISVRPERQDSSFSWNDFYDKINNNFIDNIGNLVNRIFVYSHKNFEGKLAPQNYNETMIDFTKQVNKILKNIEKAYEQTQLKNALKGILEIGRLGNRFFQEQEPWVKIKENKGKVAQIINILLHLVKDIAISIAPIMPETSNRLARMLNLSNLNWDLLGDFACLKDDLNETEILFEKLTPEIISDLKDLFGEKEPDKFTVDLRVGKIIAGKNHSNNENLYVLDVNFGEGKNRQTVAGIRKFYNLDELVGKKVVGVVNLPPIELHNVLSEAILLTAIKHKKMELLEVDGANVGVQILCNEEMPKEKGEISLEEFKSLDLKVVDNIFLFGKKPLIAGDINIQTKIIISGQVR